MLKLLQKAKTELLKCLKKMDFSYNVDIKCSINSLTILRLFGVRDNFKNFTILTPFISPVKGVILLQEGKAEGTDVNIPDLSAEA